jgi:DNA-binding PadR family transcriptional regulator
MKLETHRSALGVILLGMLFEEPMHAYRLQKLIKQRGLDTVVNVRQRAGVYQALGRLLHLGLIEVRGTAAKAKSPSDRVVYAITDRGREIAMAMLPRMLANIGTDFPKFPAVFSLLARISPEDARQQFELRADAARTELRRLGVETLEAGDLPRLSLLNNEYRAALLEAELKWIQTVIADFTSGSFAWGDAKHREAETSENGSM